MALESSARVVRSLGSSRAHTDAPGPVVLPAGLLLGVCVLVHAEFTQSLHVVCWPNPAWPERGVWAVGNGFFFAGHATSASSPTQQGKGGFVCWVLLSLPPALETTRCREGQ